MYIIDKNKDFYDYFSHIYGEDKAIVYDRRRSILADDGMIAEVSRMFSHPLRKNDETFIVLEVGNTQYLIKFLNFVLGEYDEIKSYDIELIRVFKDNKHYYDSPLTIIGVDLQRIWRWRKKDLYKIEGSYREVVKTSKKRIINPIIAKTKLTSILNPQDVWIDLQTYISSLDNDKDVSIPMTDVERAEIHGFDKKTSFRHPIK